MNIVIKKMETDAEIKGKAYVHWKSWQEAYSGIVDQRYLDSLTLDKCEKIAFRRTDNVIIAKDGDSVIGFVGFGKYRNDELENAGLENAGEVFAIYILSQYYGKGIGYRLMQTALSELADHSKIAVWVLKENTKAKKDGTAGTDGGTGCCQRLCQKQQRRVVAGSNDCYKRYDIGNCLGC